MVETQLTPELIQEGAALITKLDADGVSPEAALWLYFADSGAWRLLLGEKKVGTRGPREVYRAVQRALHSLRNEVAHLSLEDVSVATPDAPEFKALRQVVTTGPGIGGMRLGKNIISDDAYIYRLKPAAQRHRHQAR